MELAKLFHLLLFQIRCPHRWLVIFDKDRRTKAADVAWPAFRPQNIILSLVAHRLPIENVGNAPIRVETSGAELVSEKNNYKPSVGALDSCRRGSGFRFTLPIVFWVVGVTAVRD